jgi:hypothetical protein
MPYAEGSWGEKAKQRSKKRTIYFVDYRKNTQEKVKARRLVERAVIRGDLKRSECSRKSEICNSKIEGHHFDYSKPLEVLWVCSRHHREIHNEMDLAKNGTKNCVECGVEIFPPKKRFCGNNCVLRQWRAKQKLKI